MRYINGNYIVRSYSTRVFGLTKTALRINEKLEPAFPDSIDLKISNKCRWGCPFCHENSVPGGKIFDIDKTKAILSQLPPKTPIELAIGGGNLFESIDEISPFIDWAKDYGFLVRCTINHKDIVNGLSTKESDFLAKFGGIGISIDKIPESKFIQMVDFEVKNRGMLGYVDQEEVSKLNNQYLYPFNISRQGTARYDDPRPYPVYHIIAGIFPAEQFSVLARTGVPILILGYKQWGRARESTLPNQEPLRKEIESYIKDSQAGRKQYFLDNERSILSFDGLALEQLGIRDFLEEKDWNKVYLGDEGSCSMYIDAVEGQYAKTSRSAERRSWNDVGLLEFFKDDSISV